MQAQTITGSGFVATFFALVNSAIFGATFQMSVQSIVRGSNVVTFGTIDSFFMSKVMFWKIKMNNANIIISYIGCEVSDFLFNN